MSPRIRTATAEERERLWPVVSADHLFASRREYLAFCDEAPWRLRLAEKGEAALLGPWREHLRVLAMRSVWCAERAVPDFVMDALELAAAHGFTSVLSPLLPDVLLRGYLAAGMRIRQHIVAIQGHPELMLPADAPLGVEIREGSRADLAAVAKLDAECFDAFWGYAPCELEKLLATERLAVARARGGAIIGYTLATVSRGAATLSRLAVAEHARRAGVARALLAESAAWALSQGAVTFALCTQEENSASRALYASAGLAEIDERYAMAVIDVG